MATDPTGNPTGNPTGPAPSLVDRAKNMIITPKTEWEVVDAEPATIGGIYTSYVMILAAIPAVATTLGMLFFMPRMPTVEAFGRALGLPVITTGSIIAGGVINYILALVGVYVMALIIDALAPSFGGTKDQMKAFKVAAYYPTAAWVAGILAIIPLLGILVLVAAIYSLYTLYLGLPRLMRVPQEKSVGYFVVTLVVAIVVFMVIGWVQNRIVYGGFI
jgi:hypothetical protein